MEKIIVVAGATGDLGRKITQALLSKGAQVHALVRAGSDPVKSRALQSSGAKVLQVDFSSVFDVARGCEGASCVVSALSGLRDVIIDAQNILLDGAVEARVPRFIPSDFSIDFTELPIQANRNLGFRKEFHHFLDRAPIAATSVFNGAFTEMITGKMPLILYKFKRVMCWGDPDQKMDFTTMDDVATYTASLTLDNSSPRYLRIAGDQRSAREICKTISELTGDEYKIFRPGSTDMLAALIRVAKFLQPGSRELYPAWQGMQYMHNMMEGEVLMRKKDNDRYPTSWTTIRDVLTLNAPVTQRKN